MTEQSVLKWLAIPPFRSTSGAMRMRNPNLRPTDSIGRQLLLHYVREPDECFCGAAKIRREHLVLYAVFPPPYATMTPALVATGILG
ncbi:hypothetical protein BDD12DRAFT_885309 [Trichophaea hybrida]|nr:hypothetical protein BDD12DRAFT_885309 [Trichophaea hybrida]